MTHRDVVLRSVLIVAGILACATQTRSTADVAAGVPAAPGRYEAVSQLGDTLRALPLSAETRTRYEAQLASARAAYERSPSNPDSIIWLARRLAYLGRIRESIDVYSNGIRLHPANPWFYRHRGHRYITLRRFDDAIRDLERAAEVVKGKPDEIEPDGQPNARNIPIGTLHSNIDYHLALAYYLKGNYECALPIYRRELTSAGNDDRRVSIAYWLYMSLRRMGRHPEAEQVVAPITRDLTVIENETYLRLLLMFKGALPADSVLPAAADGQMSVTDATAAYGVGNWHLVNGRRDEAMQVFRRILAAGQWGAFGYIAAEAEVARAARPPGEGDKPSASSLPAGGGRCR